MISFLKWILPIFQEEPGYEASYLFCQIIPCVLQMHWYHMYQYTVGVSNLLNSHLCNKHFS